MSIHCSDLSILLLELSIPLSELSALLLKLIALSFHLHLSNGTWSSLNIQYYSLTPYSPLVAAFVAADVQSPCPSPSVPSPFSASPYLPSQTGRKVPPQSGPSLPPVVAVAPQQRVVELECCGDIGVLAAQESVPPPTAHGVVGCSPSDAPPQSDPQDDLDCQGQGSWGAGGSLEIPRGKKEEG